MEANWGGVVTIEQPTHGITRCKCGLAIQEREYVLEGPSSLTGQYQRRVYWAHFIDTDHVAEPVKWNVLRLGVYPMSNQPRRIQRKRVKGWRMPEGAVYVGRPSKWGNPYRVSGETTALIATRLFRDMLNRAPVGDGQWGRTGETVFDTIRRELRGHDLVCWCPLDAPCHADVLLQIANEVSPWVTNR